MSIRKIQFVNNEFYHIFNRGIDGRDIILNEHNLERFCQSMREFNVIDPIGSIYEKNFSKKRPKDEFGGKASKFYPEEDKLVEFICYCLNPNHYHFLLKQVSDRGIEKFMQRLGTGYTMYFNKEHHRVGSLFGGKFKAIHINSNEYLLHLSAYINLNYKAHKLGGLASKFVKSSWAEYTSEEKNGFCKKDIILNQFKSVSHYEKFAESSLEDILNRKEKLKELLKFTME